MSDDDSLVEEFFSEVNDKYYPQVLEGIDLLDEQCIEEGIDVLSRPLHTIKGVTGFMSGFEPASTFTHKVESYLKKMQAGEVDHKLPQIALAIESVNTIFMLIEQLRESGDFDKSMTDEIESRLQGIEKDSGLGGSDNIIPVEVESSTDADIIKILARRMYHPDQLEAVDQILKNVAGNKKILIDFELSMSAGSSLFEVLANYSDEHEIGITGMNSHCTSTFYSWGFQKYLSVFDSRDNFLK